MMDARNPPRYERGIIITAVLISFLSMSFPTIQGRVEQDGLRLDAESLVLIRHERVDICHLVTYSSVTK